MILEACVGSLKQAIDAKSKGAHQIELCDRLDLDGTSPSINTVVEVCKQVQIPTKVIVNPKPFDYHYSPGDFEAILTYVQKLNDLPIGGIVFGPLDPKGYPDLKQISQISEITKVPITYHKAIDASENISQSTQMLADQGIVQFILSSGGQKTAQEGVPLLHEMKSLLQNSTIELIAAGSITSENLADLHQQLNLKYYHGKKIVGNLS
ncbi:MAG: copper homeostasis protein CutC [Bacteroidota bacterium]